MKTEQRREGQDTTGMAGWYRDAEGRLVLWRAFLVLLALALISALVASAAGLGSAATAVIMALLLAALAHALVLTPLSQMQNATPTGPRQRVADTGTMDALTRTPNRRGITASLLDAMAYANRYGHPLSVALVDLDLLRDINAGLGRKAGDRALQSVAAVFTDALRMPDRAGRFGGEEFLVILPNTVLKNAVRIAERLRDGVEKSGSANSGSKLPVTVSIGVAQFRKGEDLERFLSRVDKALSTAKSSGRNRVASDKP